MLIHGDSLKSCIIAVIVADPDFVKKYASQQCMDETNLQAVIELSNFKKDVMESL
jgi:hypothetical protein